MISRKTLNKNKWCVACALHKVQQSDSQTAKIPLEISTDMKINKSREIYLIIRIFERREVIFINMWFPEYSLAVRIPSWAMERSDLTQSTSPSITRGFGELLSQTVDICSDDVISQPTVYWSNMDISRRGSLYDTPMVMIFVVKNTHLG